MACSGTSARQLGASARSVRAALALVMLVVGPATLLLGAPAAEALPSYARQTGQECAACHNGFPELTPYGRLFKLNGYTFKGGTSDLPPIAATVITSFTNTGSGQPGGPAPHYAANDNPAFETASLFYGGAIAGNVGAFAQVTYDNVARQLHWDNTDIRYARATTLFGSEAVFGATLNNNPTVTDVWNSTPAWSYPYQASGLAPAPGAATLIESLGQQVVGATTYAYLNRLWYAEFGLYRSFSPQLETNLNASLPGQSIKGVAPYWRLAVEPQWGRNSLEFGTFGLAASLNPGGTTGFGTDHTVDVGFDTQYQYLANHNSFSVQASWITENDSLTASGNPALGFASNTRDHLRSLHLKTSYWYDQTYGATGGFFRVDGSSDALLYAPAPISGSATGSPNSQGWIGEVDFIPFNYGGPSFWAWLNVKFGLQYTYYAKFNGGTGNYDGSGRNAQANNTLYLYAWLAF